MIEQTTFTLAARRAVEAARMEAALHGADEVLPEHLVAGALDSGSEGVVRALSAVGVDPGMLRDALLWGLQDEGGTAKEPGGKPRLSTGVARALKYAAREADLIGDGRVDALHLLMGALHEGKGPVCEVSREAGVSLTALREHALRRSLKSRGGKATNSVAGPSIAGIVGALRSGWVFLALVGVMAGSGLGLYFGASGALATALTVVFVMAGWISSVCLHEFGHAAVAYLGGDTSVREKGYLTLNPLKYAHPVLSVVVPALLLLIGALPFPGGAVYINDDALRNRRWEMAVAAAGPAATLLFALLVSAPFFFDWQSMVTDQNYSFWPALALLALLEIISFIFNLLPLPPLDGFRLFAPWIDRNARETIYGFSNLIFVLPVLVLMNDNPVTRAFWNATYYIAGLLHIPLDWAFYAMELLPSLNTGI